MIVKVYGNEYSGCEGWRSWLMQTYEVVQKDNESLEACKKRVEKELDEKHSSTYVRITLKWFDSLPVI